MDTSAVNSSPVALSFEKPMGRMIDLAYAHKVRTGEHEPRAGDRFQREQYRKATIYTVQIQFWLDVSFLSSTAIGI